MNRFIKAFRKVRQTFNEMPRGSAVGGTFRHALFVLLLLIAGVGSAWADMWDGTIKKDADNQTAPNGIKGKGTEADPYLINDANGFAYFMRCVHEKRTGYNSYWKLDADIDLNNHPWAHGSNTGNSFQGHFDGGNHTVSNVKLDVTTTSNYGLFPTIQGASATALAEVKNLKIVGVTFTSTTKLGKTTRLGALAGYTKQANISDVSVSNVKFTYADISDEHDMGGVIGCAETVVSLDKVSVDGVTATFSGTTTNLYIAGLVGKINSQTSITGCSTNNVTVTYNASANASRISGLVGYAKGAAGAPIKISGCTVTGTKINLTKGISNASYIGVLLAQGDVGTEITSTTNKVSTSSINISGDVSVGTNYIGTVIGSIAGSATVPSKATNVTLDKSDIVIGTTKENNIVGVRAGVIGNVSKNVTLDTWKVTGNSSITVNGNLITTESRLGGFVGFVETDTNQPVSIKGITMSGSSKIDVTGNVGKASHLGGAFGYIGGKLNGLAIINNVKVASPEITVAGQVMDVSYYGGFLGYANIACDLSDITLTSSPKIVIKGSVAKKSFVGSAIGAILSSAAVASKAKNVTINGNPEIVVGSSTEYDNITELYAGVIGQATTNVTLDTWTVNGNTNVTINGKFMATGSYVGGFAGRMNSAANAPLTVKKIKITGNSNVTLTGNIDVKDSRLGGFAGYVDVSDAAHSNVALNDLSILGTSTVTVGGNLTAANYIGGFFGQVQGKAAVNATVKINKVSVSKSDVTISGNVTAGSYHGGLAGYVSAGSCIFDDWKIGDSKVSVKGNLTAGSYIGGAFGRITAAEAYPHKVSNVVVENTSDVVIGSASTNTVNALKTGVIGGVDTNVLLDTWTVASSKVTVNGDIITAESDMGGFIGYANAAVNKLVSVKNITLSKSIMDLKGELRDKEGYFGGFTGRANTGCSFENVMVNTPEITFSKKFSSTCYVGGAFGSFEGAASCPSLAMNVDAAEPTVTVNGETKAVNAGGLFGRVNTNCQVKDCSVDKPLLTFNDSIKGESNIGSGIGYVVGGSSLLVIANNLTVTKPTLNIKGIQTKSYVGNVFGRINTYASIDKVILTEPTLNYKANSSVVELYVGTVAGYIVGNAAQQVAVTNVTLDNSSLTFGEEGGTGDFGNLRAGIIGYAATNVLLSTWTVNGNTSVKVNGNLKTSTSYLGGFAGNVTSAENAPTTIMNVTINGNSTVGVTGNTNSTTHYLGGIFGDVIPGNNVNTEVVIDNVKISGKVNVSVAGLIGVQNTSDNKYYGNVLMGGFAGRVSGRDKLNNAVKVNNIQLADVTVTAEKDIINGSYFGGLVGYVNTACEFTDMKISTQEKLSLNGDVKAGTYVGAAFGRLDGTAAHPTTVSEISVKNPKVSVNGNMTNTLYVGGLAGYQTISTVKESTVDGGEIVLNGNNTGELYVGGAAGRLNPTTAPFATVQQVEVKNLKIRTEGTHTYAKEKNFVVGGVVGYVEQSNATKLSEVRNCVADGVDINLSGFVPEAANTSDDGKLYNYKKNYFVIGGVIGRIQTPKSLPEALFFSGKIYAPNAVVAPIIGVFYTNGDKAEYAYDDYSGANAGLSEEEWEKASTWKYGVYQLGLSSDVLSQTERTKNFADDATFTMVDGVKYLTVTSSALVDNNKIGTTDKTSKTVLVYTNSGSDADKTIYPKWADNAKTYPKYYMYYMQGVNRGEYEENVDEDLLTEILTGIHASFIIADAGARGISEHTLTIKKKSESVKADSYKWYVDETLKQSGAGTEYKITPAIAGNQIKVEAYLGGELVETIDCVVRPVLRVKDDTKGMETFGTKDNPYVLGGTTGSRELQLLSYLSTLDATVRWEGKFTSKSHYNKAYYELDADINMQEKTAKVDNFTPISFPVDGTTGYSQDYVFDGVFDGQFHTIKNLKQTWEGGLYDTDNMNIGWGLFSCIGNANSTVKVGDTSASPAVVRNIVLNTFTLSHKADNVSFKYKNGFTDNANNVMVGALAGIVSNNTLIENVEVRKLVISDDSKNAREYSLAGKGLFVGGVVGSVQSAFNNTVGSIMNVVIKNMVVDADVTLKNTKIQEQDFTHLASFNVAGIVGRYAATAQSATVVEAALPRYVLYRGTINAPLAFISPVVAATRYSSNQALEYQNISRIWEANNNSTEQLKTVDALYYDFYIVDANGVSHKMTDEYPEKECKNGARPINPHADSKEDVMAYNPESYQGINLGARYIDSNTYYGDANGGKRIALAILNNHDDVTRFWKWGSGYNVPQMTETKNYATRAYGAYIEADEEVADRYYIVLSNLTKGVEGYKYDWYINGVLKDDSHGYYIDLSADLDDIIIQADVRNTSGAQLYARTQYHVIRGKFNLAPYIENTDDTYSIHLARGEEDIDLDNYPNLGISYQWYKGDVVNVKSAEKLDGQTAKEITITKDELGEVNNLFCHVTIKHNTETDKVYYDDNVNYFVGEANVIYLQLAETVTDSRGAVHEKPLISGIGTVDDPVTTWENAYAKLNGYTEPTKDYVEGHGGTWTKADVYDDEAYYLAHKDEYPYDTYKRDGNKRKVKPIDQCTQNWNNNIIVLMGLSTEGYYNKDNNKDGGIANKPVTVTGMWNGVHYRGYISHGASDLSINADHKFENIGFGLYHPSDPEGSIRYRIYAHRWNVWIGRGVLTGYAAVKKWGLEENYENKITYIVTKADISTGTPAGESAADVAIMGGYLNDATSDNPEMFDWINHGRDDIGQQIKFESGLWGPVSPGNRQTDDCTSYIMGGPDHPAKTVVTVDIDPQDNVGNELYNFFQPVATLDMGCLLSGNHEGTMYSDATLNILSGRMGRLVNGSKGSQRGTKKDLKYNPTSFETDGHYRHIVKYSVDGTDKWYEIGNPPTDSYFGRGIINIDPESSQNNAELKNDRVSVVELYCGGLGRAHNDGSYHPEASTYFYGLSEINITGGKFKNTIFGSGAGGVNGIGTAENHTDDNGLPYWNTEYDSGKTHVWYAPYEYVKGNGHNYDFVKVKVANDNGEDNNLTADGYVDLEKTRNIINITGGVFGSLDHEVSIYAGGNGVSDPSILNPSPSKNGANIKNIGNTPNHQAGNIYGAAEGLTSQINISGDAVIYGSIFGGGKGSSRYYRYFLRAAGAGADKTYSYTNANQEYTRIAYARDASNGTALGLGELNTPTTGYEWLKIQNQRLNADNYLSLGQVYGNTKITIGGDVMIYGNVYGAGEGVKDVPVKDMFSTLDPEFGLMSDQYGSRQPIMDAYGTASNGKRTAHFTLDDKFVSFPNMGGVTGTTCLDISGNVIIHGNVYGGGQTVVNGDATLNISDNVQIYGRVFGGGKGLTVDKAQDYTKLATIANTNLNIKGNVTVWQDIYGGGENATITGNANLNLEGGNFAGSIYGGGMGTISTTTNGDPLISSANVGGDTQVSIKGGHIMWEATSLADELLVNQTIIHVFYKETQVGEDIVIDTKRFVGDELKDETRDELIADGYEYTQEVEDNHLAKGDIIYWDRERTNMKGDDIRDGDDGKKYAYKLFYDDANKRFNITHNIFAGGAVASHVAGNATVTVTSGMFGDDLIATKHWQDAYPDAKSAHFAVFGGGNGSNTTVNNTKVTVGSELATAAGDDIDPDNFYGVAGSTVHGVVGGSYGGIVLGNTDVVIRNTYTHHVYGGGFGDLSLYNQLSDETVIHDEGNGTTYGREDLGLVKGNTKVRAEGGYVHTDIFGGGCGVESAHKLNESSYVPVTSKNTIDKDFTMGQVLGATDVELIGSARVQHSLYGGGDIASVLGQTVKAGDDEAPQQTTKVILRSGLIIGDVFGGGNGRLVSQVKDHADGAVEAGSITGNTLVIVESQKDDDNNIVAVPEIRGSVYGGGSYTQVKKSAGGADDGNTYVTVAGGNIGGDIFGGGLGDIRTVSKAQSVTNAHVQGTTNVTIDGGAFIDVDGAEPANHNVYGGGNVASVNGATYVTVKRGMLDTALSNEVYDTKHAPKYSVFGAGYGENTSVAGDTHVTVDVDFDGAADLTAEVIDNAIAEAEEAGEAVRTPFKAGQTVMDVYGGGYYGAVTGATHVELSGKSYIRNAFGGSFNAFVNETNVNVNSVAAENVFGGGMIGDVTDVHLTVGAPDAESNDNIYIINNVYGGNDVSGNVTQVSANIFGGNIYNNVYGVGNGDYLYTLGSAKVVTPHEDFESADGQKYDLVYEVPLATGLSNTVTQKVIATNFYRPTAENVVLNLSGSESKPLNIAGNVFGGGNSTTVNALTEGNIPSVTFNIGSYCNLGGVYMGSDGEAMLQKTAAFQNINGTDFSYAIAWSNGGLNEKFLPVEAVGTTRKLVYPKLFDLYFAPVAMAIQPALNWVGSIAADGTVTGDASALAGTTIGTFVCGAKHGNMNVKPDADGKIVDYTFPAGLTIKNRIVGGCDDANLTLGDLTHVGGYLLGTRDDKSDINLTVECQFAPEATAESEGNVYGGCYNSGTVNGDVKIDMRSNMLANLSDAQVQDAKANEAAVASVFGAGYGMETMVNGQTEVLFGKGADGKTASALNVFGAGQQGNLVGNSTVKVLNGHVAGNVAGGTYAGRMWGSAQVLVGYPKYYTVKNAGTYNLSRADRWNASVQNFGGTDVIKKQIKLLAGDIISEEVYDAIVEANASQSSKFTAYQMDPAQDSDGAGWDDIDIKIDGATYGGGYSLTEAGAVGMYENTVLKYDNEHYANTASKLAYGGNTTVLVCDNVNGTEDHIAISNEDDAASGIFGDGHLTFAEGFRAGELNGYGYAEGNSTAAKFLNTIQRMDMLRVSDCAVQLAGARDYNLSEVSTAPYSLARIGELQMKSSITDATLQSVDQLRSRNFMGLSYSTHNLGAVTSDVAFTERFHDSEGAQGSETYRAKKQNYITDGTSIEARNAGTAKNMISITSGHALKIANAKVIDATGKEQPFYGPIVGVVEIALANSKKDEAGAYVYAANIHHRENYIDATTVPESHKGTEDFLETTGNFMLAYNEGDARYLLDDCYKTGYDKQTGKVDGQPNSEEAEAHYWYVTGWEYFFNTNITGYTYNTNNTFYAKNDGSINLVNILGDTEVTVESIEWDSKHSAGYEDELENRNVSGGTDASGNDVTGKYKLFIGTSDALKYDMSDNKPAQGAYLGSDTERASLSFANNAAVAKMAGKTVGMEDNILIALQDEADNHGKDYYNAHFAEPCKATIVLSAPAKEEDGTAKYKYTIADNFNVGEAIPSGNTYYYKDGDNYVEATSGTAAEAQWPYYTREEGRYRYTIYLDINYVKGPEYSGNILVENCALPGEMIKVSLADLNVETSPLMPAYGFNWKIGPRSQDAEGKWTIDNDKAYTYKIGSPYDEALGDGNATSKMLAGVKYNEAGKYIEVPAYYFMNGYGVEYNFYVASINEGEEPINLTVEMRDQDMLTVHNYHRMSPRNADGITEASVKIEDLHVDLAAQRSATDGNFAAPRIYIADGADLAKFTQFLAEENGYGQDMQFHLLNNVDAESVNAAANFNGTLHGDGYVISGINNYLFTKNDGGNIYNLGMKNGLITKGDNGSANSKYHTSYTWSNMTVYNMDGNAVKYSNVDDWRYGKVANDLNGYYLLAHQFINNDDHKIPESNFEAIYDIYRNGDYLYARTQSQSAEYLRTTSLYDANYNSSATYSRFTRDENGVITHPVDQSRAVYVDEKFDHYAPLFEAAYSDDSQSELTAVKNDFIFFGQYLNADTKYAELATVNVTMPGNITPVSHEVEQMKNRVYRAVGYYASKDAYQSDWFCHNADAYVHANGITAIDFHGYNGKGSGQYVPVIDYRLNGIQCADGATRNLLVYAREAADATTGVLKSYVYDENTPEGKISMHVITPADDKLETQYLHLVERTADNMDAEGNECLNNDFSTPVAFNVTKRAWYTRQPANYADNNNDAWEGICLPFTAKKVVAATNGEITHFYGTAAANVDPKDNDKTLHHEYWLRGLTAVTTTADDKTTANFQRPGTDGGLFATPAMSEPYVYNNSYFSTLPGYNSEDNDWYTKSHEYAGYTPLTANIPYIVSFPGERYYEFDLSGQTITFSYDGETVIPVTSEMNTAADNYLHNGTFVAADAQFGLNEDGVEFNASVNEVLPFRTYMTALATSGKAMRQSIIFIGNNAEMTEDMDKQQMEVEFGDDYLKIYPKGKSIIVESSRACQLSCHGISGSLIGNWNIKRGTNVFSNLRSGIYVVGGKKMVVK